METWRGETLTNFLVLLLTSWCLDQKLFRSSVFDDRHWVGPFDIGGYPAPKNLQADHIGIRDTTSCSAPLAMIVFEVAYIRSKPDKRFSFSREILPAKSHLLPKRDSHSCCRIHDRPTSQAMETVDEFPAAACQDDTERTESGINQVILSPGQYAFAVDCRLPCTRKCSLPSEQPDPGLLFAYGGSR